MNKNYPKELIQDLRYERKYYKKELDELRLAIYNIDNDYDTENNIEILNK